MKTDKVIAFAKQVEADFDGSDWNFGASFDGDQLQRFAELVRNDALDEITKLLDQCAYVESGIGDEIRGLKS